MMIPILQYFYEDLMFVHIKKLGYCLAHGENTVMMAIIITTTQTSIISTRWVYMSNEATS